MTARPARILIVSPSLLGLHREDPAGHAAWHLARRLAAEGAAPDILVPRDSDTGQRGTLHWGQLRQAGIGLHVLPLHDGADGMLGWRAVEFLRANIAPDAVVVIDQRGIGSSLLAARRMGLALAGVPIIACVTGPAGWAAAADAPATPAQLLRAHIECQAIAGADALLFIHPWLAEWNGDAGGRPVLVTGPLGEASAEPGLRAEHILADPLPCAVAIGRVAQALRGMPGATLRMAIPPNEDAPTHDPIAAMAAALGDTPLRLGLPGEAGRRRRTLPAQGAVVMAERDTLGAPLVQDALAAGIMVLGPDADGRIAPLPPIGTVPRLLPFLRGVTAPPAADTAIRGTPLVSVCISHFDRPTLLAQTLDSLRAQTWPHVEVVLVDDASPSAATRDFLAAQEADFAARGWQIIRNKTELWQSTSRNLAARAARGEYVLVMDDDNLARPEEIEVMLRAMQSSGADAVAALQDLFTGDHNPLLEADAPLPRVEFFPVGGPPDVGLAWNIYGDVNVMFRRDTFLELGGYSEDPELGCEDYELGAKLVMSGRKLVVVPTPLYLYRFSAVNMAKGMSNERLYWSHRRPLRPPQVGLTPAQQRLTGYVHGAEHARQQIQGWSYWAGRPESRPWPEEGITDPGAPGCDFQLYAAALALQAGDPGPALRMLPAMQRAAPDDARIASLLARAGAA